MPIVSAKLNVRKVKDESVKTFRSERVLDPKP